MFHVADGKDISELRGILDVSPKRDMIKTENKILANTAINASVRRFYVTAEMRKSFHGKDREIERPYVNLLRKGNIGF